MSTPSPDMENNLIAVLIETFVVFGRQGLEHLREAVQMTRVLPGHLGTAYGYSGIRHDLTVWWVDDTRPYPTHPILDERNRNAVLFLVSQRYPELASLCPQRPADAVTCDRAGTGLLYSPQTVIECRCGGLGWLPAPDPLAAGEATG